MEEVASMHETFCDFHKVFIRKTKPGNMTVNGEGVQVRWRPEKGKTRARRHPEKERQQLE